jgi:galactose mutarotase-like enzyme
MPQVYAVLANGNCLSMILVNRGSTPSNMRLYDLQFPLKSFNKGAHKYYVTAELHLAATVTTIANRILTAVLFFRQRTFSLQLPLTKPPPKD